MLVFFDDYANTVLLGNTLQPLSDRLKISREKLAFLVDSTAAPVAGLALISTWVAGEISYVQEGLEAATAEKTASAFQLFVDSIPYRFYVLYALAFVFLVGLLQRDYGPMLTAERRTLATDNDEGKEQGDVTDSPSASGWWNAVIPVVLTVFGVLYLMVHTGVQSLGLEEFNLLDLNYRDVLGQSDTYYALLWGTMFGLISAVLLTVVQRLLTFNQVGEAAAHGAKLMLPAIAVLWLASALSALTGNKSIDGSADYALDYRLYTGEYMASLIVDEESQEPAPWLQAVMPTIIFLLSAGISFATGTSWGTMAIVMPVAITSTYPLIADDPAWTTNPILICAVGSVLAGSIFGDHCSPISDTTVLSSQSCGCDHTAHVVTQLPYALTVGLVSVVFGTLPVGFGIPVWLLLPSGIAVLVIALLLIGKRTAES